MRQNSIPFYIYFENSIRKHHDIFFARSIDTFTDYKKSIEWLDLSKQRE